MHSIYGVQAKEPFGFAVSVSSRVVVGRPLARLHKTDKVKASPPFA